jgi:Domain of unknown function (DUF4345)
MNLKNLHLIISVIIVIPVALVYGFKSDLLFDLQINSIDQANVFKAIMGLYLGFGSLWIMGIFKNDYWKMATVSNMCFMLGLGFGRIISLFVDGIPSTIFVLGLFGELILGFYALYELQKKREPKLESLF